MKTEKPVSGDKQPEVTKMVRPLAGNGQVVFKPEEKMRMNKVIGGVFVIIVLLGIVTGYVLAKQYSASGIVAIGGSQMGALEPGKIYGSSDTATFSDWAEGKLVKGGIKGEGTHALERDGGPSQTAYLISSVVDLDAFVSKKVKVWGKTVDAVYAPWLMDVGRLEILAE